MTTKAPEKSATEAGMVGCDAFMKHRIESTPKRYFETWQVSRSGLKVDRFTCYLHGLQVCTRQIYAWLSSVYKSYPKKEQDFFPMLESIPLEVTKSIPQEYAQKQSTGIRPKPFQNALHSNTTESIRLLYARSHSST